MNRTLSNSNNRVLKARLPITGFYGHLVGWDLYFILLHSPASKYHLPTTNYFYRCLENEMEITTWGIPGKCCISFFQFFLR